MPEDESPPGSVDALIDEWPDEPETKTEAKTETEGVVTLDGEEKTIDELVSEWAGGDLETKPGNGESESSDESWDAVFDRLNGPDENGAPPQRPYADVGTKHRLDALEEHANARDQQLRSFVDNRDLSDHIAKAKATLARPDLTDSFIQTWLVDHARTHPSIHTAWDNRFQDPANWQDTFDRAINRLRNVLPEVPDDNNNQDRVAAMNFVRGSSTKEVPPAPVSDKKLSGMSDQEFNDYQKTIGINS